MAGYTTGEDSFARGCGESSLSGQWSPHSQQHFLQRSQRPLDRTDPHRRGSKDHKDMMTFLCTGAGLAGMGNGVKNTSDAPPQSGLFPGDLKLPDRCAIGVQ